MTDEPNDRGPDPWAVHARMARAVGSHVARQHQTHTFSMLARESILHAQDMLIHTDAKLTRKIGKRLAKIRAALEALDCDFRNAGGT